MFINHSPSTISKEAREIITSYKIEDRNQILPLPDDFSAWKSLRGKFEEEFAPLCNEVEAHYKPEINEIYLGGVPALDINPSAKGPTIVYIHGGAFTLFSVRSTLYCSVPVAAELSARVISIEYTLAPHAKWDTILDQVIAAVKALVSKNLPLDRIVFFGDSAGGSLAAGAALKMRDEGMGMPKALVLWSPWADISETGDTYTTLKEADPVLFYPDNLQRCALAYAPPELHHHPYVSPVYGNYAKGFPPTLIQAGTKEIFLSNAVRQYRALDSAGIPVKLDLYEGMWHVFQGLPWNLPESRLARQNMKRFVT